MQKKEDKVTSLHKTSSKGKKTPNLPKTSL